MKQPRFTQKTAFIILALFIASVVIPQLLWPNPSSISTILLAAHRISPRYVIDSAALLLLTLYFKRYKETGFTGWSWTKQLRLLWLPATYISCFFLLAARESGYDVTSSSNLLINTLLIGFSEELLFRGILFDGIASKHNAAQTVGITAVIFGALHLANSLYTGDYATAVTQAAINIMSGVFYGAIRVRLNSIVPGMLVHALWDFSTLLYSFGLTNNPAAAQTAAPSFTNTFLFAIIFILPLLLYGLYLIRDPKFRQAPNASDPMPA